MTSTNEVPDGNSDTASTDLRVLLGGDHVQRAEQMAARLEQVSDEHADLFSEAHQLRHELAEVSRRLREAVEVANPAIPARSLDHFDEFTGDAFEQRLHDVLLHLAAQVDPDADQNLAPGEFDVRMARLIETGR